MVVCAPYVVCSKEERKKYNIIKKRHECENENVYIQVKQVNWIK
jgi:hypothetical protein